MGYDQTKDEVEDIFRRWERITTVVPDSIARKYVVTNIDWAEQQQEQRQQALKEFERVRDDLKTEFRRIVSECQKLLIDGLSDEDEIEDLESALETALAHLQRSESIDSDYLMISEFQELDSLQWQLQSHSQVAKHTIRFALARRAQIDRAEELRKRLDTKEDELQSNISGTEPISYPLATFERILSSLKQIEADIDRYREFASGELPPETLEFQELLDELNDGEMLEDVSLQSAMSADTLQEQCRDIDRKVRHAEAELHLARADAALTDAIDTFSRAFQEIETVPSDQAAIMDALDQARSELEEANTVMPEDDPLLREVEKVGTGCEKLRSRLESTEAFAELLQHCDSTLTEFRAEYGTYCGENSRASQYLKQGAFDSLEELLQDASDYVNTAQLEVSSIASEFPAYEGAIEVRQNEIATLNETLAEHNNEFTEVLNEEYPEVFVDAEGHKLNERQREAVIADEDRVLVSAPAGTGKTKTINHRLKYLINVEGIPTEKILPTGFANSTVDELEERIKFPGVQPQTLDTLALNISKAANPSFQIPDTGPGESPAEKSAKQLFDRKLDEESDYYDPQFERDLIRLMRHWETEGNRDLPQEVDDTTPDPDGVGQLEYYLEKHGFKPMRDEPIRDVEETFGEGEYVADLFLPEFNLVVSHLPIISNPFDEHQSKVDPLVVLQELSNTKGPVIDDSSETTLRELKAQVEWEKRRFDELEDYDIVFTYEWENQEETLRKHLEQRFLDRFIIPIPIAKDEYLKTHSNESEQEIYGDIKDELAQALAMARTRGVAKEKDRESDSDTDQLAVVDGGVTPSKTITELYPDGNPLYKSFADVLSALYEDYEDWLDDRKRLDFIETKVRAAEYLRDHEETDPSVINEYDFDYIIVDEFQDISPTDMQFLESLVESNGAQLYCVGDDWQSIYSFRGTTPTYFLKFETHFESETNVITLNRTYRNPQSVVDASTRLISNNANQRDKDLTAHFDTEGSITIHKDSKKPMEVRTANLVEEYCNWADSTRSDPFDKSEIMVIVKLNGQTKDITDELSKRGIPAQVKQSDQDSLKDGRVVITTAHKAKGDSARHVIVYNAIDNEYGGFPDTRGESLRSPLEPAESNTFDSERRLFYVALTRTERTVDILTAANQSNQSRFIREFRSDFQTIQDDQSTAVLNRAELQRIREHGIWESDHRVLSATPLDGDKAQKLLQHAHTQTETGIALFQYFVEIIAVSQQSVDRTFTMEEAVEFYDWYVSEADQYFQKTEDDPPSATVENALAPFTSRIKRYNNAVEEGFRQLFEERQSFDIKELTREFERCSLLEVPSKPPEFEEVIEMYVNGLEFENEPVETVVEALDLVNSTQVMKSEPSNGEIDVAHDVQECVDYLRSIESSSDALHIPYPLPNTADLRWRLPELEAVGAIVVSDEILSDLRELKRLVRDPQFEKITAATAAG